MHDDSHNVLVLVRSAPDSVAAARARRAVRSARTASGSEIVVFFHGDAVAEAAAERVLDWTGGEGEGSVKLLVCQAAWMRRFDRDPVAGFEVSSLVQFWELAANADQIQCFGGAG